MDLTDEIERLQRDVCADYGALYHPSPSEHLVGVSKRLEENLEPIHGLRHPTTDGTTGWYIWAGDYSDDPDFFMPVHLRHLLELSPNVMKYLGLPPGWRFLFADGYEDVWYDGELLKV